MLSWAKAYDQGSTLVQTSLLPLRATQIESRIVWVIIFASNVEASIVAKISLILEHFVMPQTLTLSPVFMKLYAILE